jgi:hypothetical protein
MKRIEIYVLICLILFGVSTATTDLSGTEAGHKAFDQFVPALKTGEAYAEPDNGVWNAETNSERIFDIFKNQSDMLAKNIPFPVPDDPFAMASGEAENWDNYVNQTGSMEGAEALQRAQRAQEDAWTHRLRHPHTIAQFHDDMARDPLLSQTKVKNTVGQRS